MHVKHGKGVMHHLLGPYSDYALMLLRIVAGFLFLCHGAQKFGLIQEQRPMPPPSGGAEVVQQASPPNQQLRPDGEAVSTGALATWIEQLRLPTGRTLIAGVIELFGRSDDGGSVDQLGRLRGQRLDGVCVFPGACAARLFPIVQQRRTGRALLFHLAIHGDSSTRKVRTGHPAVQVTPPRRSQIQPPPTCITGDTSMHPRNLWHRHIIWILAAALAACGRGDTPSPGTSDAAGSPSQRVDVASAGHITGSVRLDGLAPANEPIKMNADPVCLREAKGPQEQEIFVVGAEGALANVFVYVKDGLGDYVYDPPADRAALDQKGCRYLPHVFGVRVAQPIEIINSDPTLHNIHALPTANREFNMGQPIQGMKMAHTFTAREVMVPFKCDVHGWMNAYVGVLDHPYFAVTNSDGRFELKSLPPGTYTVEAWHERLGTTTQSVMLDQRETKDVTFSFSAAPTSS
jgi:hypothetical protein